MSTESRTPHIDEEDASNGKDYIVCDQCRSRKIRCGRERPYCLNCSQHGRECKWSGRGKKPSQIVLLSNVVVELEARLENLENIVCGARSPLGSLNSGSSPKPAHSWRQAESMIPNNTHEQIYPSTPPITRDFGNLICPVSTVRHRIRDFKSLRKLRSCQRKDQPPGERRGAFGSLGLCHWDSLDDQCNPPRESQTGQNLLFCMYTLGNALCWTTGLSPGFRMPKTSFFVAPIDPQDELTCHWAARVKLAAIEEQIFTELYSEKPESSTDTQVPLNVTRSHQKLENWWNESGPRLDGSHDFSSFISASQAELAISFHSIRMLLNWPERAELDTSRQILFDARTCLQLFLRLWSTTSQLGLYSTLTRLISCYPPVGFCKLSAHVLTSQAEQSDPELLQTFTGILQTISGFCEPDSHCVRLCKFAEIIMDLITPPWNQQRWGQFESTSPAMQWKPSTFPMSDKNTGAALQRTPEKIDNVIAIEGSEVLPVGLPSMHFAAPSSFGGYSQGKSGTPAEMFSNYLLFDPKFNNSQDPF